MTHTRVSRTRSPTHARTRTRLLQSYYSWYRLVFDNPLPAYDYVSAFFINFGAVDWNATVWLNTRQIAAHSGGYTHFSADASAAIKATGNELIVRAYDPSDAGFQVRQSEG